MAIIKCKMCGGELNLLEGQTVAECAYCGSRQTVPVADDEKKLQQFERADWLRRNCEFDKAAAVYEAILSEFRQESEAYWGLVLCKYGIEYVDDPATGKKIPTCHRSSYDSVLDDANLEQALDYADATARKVYREEAKHLERLREGILEVSSNEQPYDIFICYKETDHNGDRTLDSVLAQDLYEALTEKGYRVFFSRITLRSKLGEAYEPYIFAALNSAKVMLAIGSDPEYYNAVWVKNEWSRFLKICAADKSKHLIPCFRDLDAYDMPKEFRPLQGVDLGKMGAVQDILFNMEKYIPLKKQTTTVIQERVLVGGSGGNKIASLLDRGNMALEDGDWAKADSFFEDVLNNDSKNAQAYLGKALAQERCRTMDAFIRKRKDTYQNVRGIWQKLEPDHRHIEEAVERYALPGFVEAEELYKLYEYDLSYRTEVPERQQQYETAESYWNNHKQLSRAEKFATDAVARNLEMEKKALFSALAERVKAAEAAEAKEKELLWERYALHLHQADKAAEALREKALAGREAAYDALLELAKTTADVAVLTDAGRKFEAMEGYRDSAILAQHCHSRAAEEQQKLDEEAERQRLLRLKKEKERKAKAKRSGILAAVAVAIVAIFLVVLNTVIIPQNQYKEALDLMAAGEYKQAIIAFEALEGYKDSATKIEECKRGILDDAYEAALLLMEEGRYNEAITAFRALAGHRDSAAKIEECNEAILEAKYESQYQAALSLMEEKKYPEAIEAFRALNGYKESAEKIAQCEEGIYEEKYQAAVALMEEKKYPEAITAFEALNGYKDSAEKIVQCEEGIYEEKYQAAVAMMEEKKYPEAITAFEALNGYKDSAEKIAQCRTAIQQQQDSKLEGQYTGAKTLMDQGQYAKAAIAFGKLGNYKDAKELSRRMWAKVIKRETISGGFNTLAVKTDGTVIAVGEDNGQCNVAGWKNIVAVSANSYHTVGLKADGTVVAVGDKTYGNQDGQCNVGSWKNIIAVCTGIWHTVGLKADGTVVAVGDNGNGQCNVGGWTDIVAIAAGTGYTVGLKLDGTVVAAGDNGAGQCNVSGWKDIIAIAAGTNFTLGLKVDGTVVATGANSDGQCNVSGWKNIVAISAGMYHTVGMKENGTVVAVGWNSYGQCDVGSMKNMIAISTGKNHTIGLKADGTVVAVGSNFQGQCNVSGWSDVMLPE